LNNSSKHSDFSQASTRNPENRGSDQSFLKAIQKKEQQAALQAQTWFQKNKRTNFLHLAVLPFFKFLNYYFFRGFLFKGIPGLKFAALEAYGSFNSYVKLLLLRKGMD